MPVIQGGRYQRGLSKLFGVKAEVVASELAPEIYSVLELGTLPGDILALFGWARYSGTIVQPANAGIVSYVQIQNPVNSGVIAVVERVEGISDTTAGVGGLIVQTGDTLLSTGLIHLQCCDKRQQTPPGVRNSSSCLLAPKANGVQGGGAISGFVSQTQTIGVISLYGQDEPWWEWPLLPGDSIGFFPGNPVTTAGVQNAGLAVTIRIRERALEPSETAV